MNMKSIMDEIWNKTKPVYLEFVAEDDERACEECKNLHGTIFHSDDPALPQLPLHPNCRCHYRMIK